MKKLLVALLVAGMALAAMSEEVKFDKPVTLTITITGIDIDNALELVRSNDSAKVGGRLVYTISGDDWPDGVAVDNLELSATVDVKASASDISDASGDEEKALATFGVTTAG